MNLLLYIVTQVKNRISDIWDAVFVCIRKNTKKDPVMIGFRNKLEKGDKAK